MDSTRKRAVAYIRVSTQEQVRHGFSLEAQEAELRRYCDAAGLDVVRVLVEEGVSAGKPLARRPRGAELLQLVADGSVDAIVGWRLDRLFRSAVDCRLVVENWDRRGVALHLVQMGGQALDTGSAMGRFFLGLMAEIAELERGQVGERIKLVKDNQRQQGRFLGGRTPYGWERASDGSLIPNPHEQQGIQLAQQLHGLGESLRAIGRELLRQGFPPKKSDRWHARVVQTVLKAEKVAV